MSSFNIVNDNEWIDARKKLLIEEKELSKKKDEIAKKLQSLPYRLIKKNYIFQNYENKNIEFINLFNNKNILVIQHFMYDDDWNKGCSSCSLWGDAINGIYPHLLRKTQFYAIANASPENLKSFVNLKKWQFPMLSCGKNTFGKDFCVSFKNNNDEENKSSSYNYTSQWTHGTEAPGFSVFYKDQDNQIYHTYSCYGRGLEQMQNLYGIFDTLPNGRNEKYPMDWLKHKEDYDT